MSKENRQAAMYSKDGGLYCRDSDGNETMIGDGLPATTESRFDAVKNEYLKFNRIKNKRSQRPDLNACILLDTLFPDQGRNMVSANGYDDVIYLDVPSDRLDELSDNHILELVRCGVSLSLGDLVIFLQND